MEAWDDGDRVRPIPLDHGDEPMAGTDHVVAPEDTHAARDPRQRPWIPLTLAIVGVAIAVTSVSIFGALRFDDDPPPDEDAFAADVTDEEGSTTTATTLPPRLDELLPAVTDRLTLMAERDGVLHALLWDPTFREPKAVPLDIEETPAARFSRAWFDRSGRFVAVERCGSLRCDLYTGTPTDLGSDPDVSGLIGFVWHATEVGRIAWVSPTEGEYAVVAGDVNPLSGSIEDEEILFTTPNPIRLVQWDAFGFVVQSTVPGATTSALDGNGSPVWERPGISTTATERIVALATSAEDGDTARQWQLLDRATGDEIPGSEAMEPTIVFVAASESADLVARLSARETGPYSLRVSGGDLSAQRIVTIQQRYAPAGFTDDGAYFMLVGGDRSLVFVQWNQGSSHEVTAPEGYRILGFDLG